MGPMPGTSILTSWEDSETYTTAGVSGTWYISPLLGVTAPGPAQATMPKRSIADTATYFMKSLQEKMEPAPYRTL